MREEQPEMVSELPPLISVVIPLYNRETSIVFAIRSVIQQTYPNFEIIVVDDASTDGSAEVVKKSFCDQRVKLVQLTQNVGACRARNIGVENAKGQWIAFLDSDDLWHPNRLSFQMNSAVDPDAGFAYCSYASYDSKGALVGHRIAPPEASVRDLLRIGNVVGSASAVLIRRDVFLSIGGFRVGLPSSQDWDLWLRAAQVTPATSCREFLVYYRIDTANSISGDPRKRIQGYIHMLGEHFRDKTLVKERKSIAYLLSDALLHQNRRGLSYRLALYSGPSLRALARALSVKVGIRREM